MKQQTDLTLELRPERYNMDQVQHSLNFFMLACLTKSKTPVRDENFYFKLLTATFETFKKKLFFWFSVLSNNPQKEEAVLSVGKMILCLT